MSTAGGHPDRHRHHRPADHRRRAGPRRGRRCVRVLRPGDDEVPGVRPADRAVAGRHRGPDVPGAAVMKLLGDDCWWAPRWMKRLQKRLGLGETDLPDERKRPDGPRTGRPRARRCAAHPCCRGRCPRTTPPIPRAEGSSRPGAAASPSPDRPGPHARTVGGRAPHGCGHRARPRQPSRRPPGMPDGQAAADRRNAREQRDARRPGAPSARHRRHPAGGPRDRVVAG